MSVRRLVLGLSMLFWVVASAAPVLAQAAPPCQFILGFATLHGIDPADVGDCLDNQVFAANGDAQQHTTNGLLAWRKLDNWTAFTNGYWTWINGPNGLAKRLNTQRYSWEANPGNLPLADHPKLPAAWPVPWCCIEQVKPPESFLLSSRDLPQGWVLATLTANRQVTQHITLVSDPSTLVLMVQFNSYDDAVAAHAAFENLTSSSGALPAGPGEERAQAFGVDGQGTPQMAYVFRRGQYVVQLLALPSVPQNPSLYATWMDTRIQTAIAEGPPHDCPAIIQNIRVC